MKRKLFAALGLLAVVSTAAYSAGMFSSYPTVGGGATCANFATNPLTGAVLTTCNGPAIPAGPVVVTGSEVVPADTHLANGQNPQTVLIPTSLLANMSGTPRNYLDNGSMNVQQRGTGIVTCAAAAAVTSAAYGPDRWGCSANVTSGAGRSVITTTAALLPVGFTSANEIYRLSGALTQPVCAIQEVPSTSGKALAGKTVTLSFYAAALAGLAADNNNAITASIIYGTGTDEGLQTMSTSPAITPAWTGVAFVVNQSAITIGTAPARYSVSGAVPSTATEVGVEICFTPTASGAGTTDGFAFTGAQLEVAPSPSAYEFHSYGYDLRQAQGFFYQITDNASTQVSIAMCSMSTTSIANCLIPFPVTMRVVPTMVYATGFAASASTASSSTTACTGNTTSATLSGQTASVNNVIMDCASSTGFGAAGTSGFLWTLGTTTTGSIKASADF